MREASETHTALRRGRGSSGGDALNAVARPLFSGVFMVCGLDVLDRRDWLMHWTKRTRGCLASPWLQGRA